LPRIDGGLCPGQAARLSQENQSMCLALPALLIEKRDHDIGIVELGGVKNEISLALLDCVEVGDYVIVHVGYALSRLDAEEAARTLALFAEMGAMSGAGT
jgi:hydrogenase expression/formation protein HypC